MSHTHAELVIPPTDDVEDAVTTLMERFYENREDDEDGYRKYAFWDYWVIGGRWSGAKLEARLDPEKLDAFHKRLADAEVTVSCVVAGKEALSPDSQQEMVDRMWREDFPGCGDVCPLFDHYKPAEHAEIDVCTVADVPERLSCGRLMIADAKQGVAALMLAGQLWNGATWQDTAFDGLVKPVLDLCEAATEWPYRIAPIMPDWLAVTVDYHS